MFLRNIYAGLENAHLIDLQPGKDLGEQPLPLRTRQLLCTEPGPAALRKP